MEEIDLVEFFKYYLGKIGIVLITILVIVLVGNYYNVMKKVPMYESNTSVILVNEKDNVNSSYNQSELLFNRNLVNTYSEIIKSRKVLGKVIENEDLDCSISELSKHITVTGVNDTEIIKITATSSDRKLAKKIANGIVPVFTKEVKRIYGIDNVNIVDEAIIAEAPYNVNYLKENLIYVLLGIVISSGVIFMCYYFDTSIKSSEMIENKYGLTVMGIVPKIEGDK